MLFDRLLQLDAHLLVWITTHRLTPFNIPFWLISVISRGGMAWFAIGAGLAIGKRISVHGFLQLSLAILVAAVVGDRIVKPLIGRQRPFDQIAGLDVIGRRPDDSSFPSGHSATAFAGASVLSRLLPGTQALWWTFAGAVAFSRLYLGVHYPLDVVAGALIGVGCGRVVMKTFGSTDARSARA